MFTSWSRTPISAEVDTNASHALRRGGSREAALSALRFGKAKREANPVRARASSPGPDLAAVSDMNRLTTAAIVKFVLLLGANSALAQDAPRNDDPVRNDTLADSATTDSAAADPTIADSAAAATTTPAELDEVRPGPTVPSCTLSHRPCAFPHLAVAIDGGVSHFTESNPLGFDTGVGSITSTGPAWGARVGVELLPWFAIDGHYIGMSNRADASQSIGGRRTLLTNAAVAELRFTLPTHSVEPYAFIGAGVYSTKITGTSKSTPLYGSTEFGVPIGLGLGVPLCPGLSLGAEIAYHRLFGEAFEDNDDIGGGDPTSATVVLRARL